MIILQVEVPFAVDFNLLSCDLITLRLHCYIKSFYTNIISNKNKFVIVSLQHSHSSL